MTPTLSEHQLCVAIRRPRELARVLKAEAKTPTPENTPRSPIRAIFTAVLRGYFKGKRQPANARKDYAEGVAMAVPGDEVRARAGLAGPIAGDLLGERVDSGA